MGTTQRSMTEASQQASAADMDFAASAKDHGPKFAFKPTPSKFTGFDDKSIKDKWLQWDMQGHFQAMKFAFDAPFAEFEKDRFLTEFFNDPNVQQTLQVVHSGLAGGGKVNWGSIGAVQAVQSKKLTTSGTTRRSLTSLRRSCFTRTLCTSPKTRRRRRSGWTRWCTRSPTPRRVAWVGGCGARTARTTSVTCPSIRRSTQFRCGITLRWHSGELRSVDMT